MDNIVSIITLESGDKFRFIGSDENQVCLVSKTEDGQLEYNSGNQHIKEYADLKYPVNVIKL